jgi:hypothetical protein
MRKARVTAPAIALSAAAGAALAMLAALGPVAAQAPREPLPGANAPTGPGGMPRSDTPAPSGPGDNAGRPSESLSERLDRTDGVVPPPPTGDSGTVIRPPDVGTMPVIPPPSPPGDAPQVPPKTPPE